MKIYRVWENNVFTSKKWTNKNDTNESWKAGAFIHIIWRVNLPSSGSSWTLTPCFGFSPSLFYFLLPHVKPCLMSIGLNLKLENRIPCPKATWVLHAPKHPFKAFSGLAFFNGRIFLHDIDDMTCYPSHFLSNL